MGDVAAPTPSANGESYPMNEGNEVTSVSPETESGRDPLPRFYHPEHGELEIYGFDGRSKLCRSVSGPAREFRIGTRVVNRLRSADARTVPLPLTTEPTPEARAEILPGIVTAALAALDDGPVRVRIAREVWAAADAFLGN